MKYTLTTPCDNCPFRTDVKPYLHPNRIEEIAGDEFSCHKTTTEKDRTNHHPKAQHCAGSLIMHEHMEWPHQMMRICERLGLYDRTQLNMNAPVYEDLGDMREAYEIAYEDERPLGKRDT